MKKRVRLWRYYREIPWETIAEREYNEGNGRWLWSGRNEQFRNKWIISDRIACYSEEYGVRLQMSYISVLLERSIVR